jgi:hypothetical protein
MPIRAYLLIEAVAGKGNSILEDLRRLDVTVQADRVTGPYDVICVMESENLDTLGEMVREHVHNTDGVVRTMTCIRFDS